MNVFSFPLAPMMKRLFFFTTGTAGAHRVSTKDRLFPSTFFPLGEKAPYLFFFSFRALESILKKGFDHLLPATPESFSSFPPPYLQSISSPVPSSIIPGNLDPPVYTAGHLLFFFCLSEHAGDFFFFFRGRLCLLYPISIA